MRDIASSIVVLSGSLLVAFGSYLNNQNSGSGGLVVVAGVIAMGCGLFFIFQSGGNGNVG